MNPITIYLLANVINFGQIAQRFVGGDIKNSLNTTVHAGVGDLLVALVAAGLVFVVAGFLYRRKIFLRA